MELHESLFAIGAMIVIAKLLEGIFKRYGLNSIIAYVAAGILLGPVTGIVETSKEIEFILSIGIFIFFFLIGLEELDIGGFLSAMRGRLFFASLLCVAISLLVSLAVTTDTFFELGLNLSFTEALALAGILSLSSLGVVAKVLVDEGRLRETVGVQMFTAVIIAELIALFVVGFAISEHGGAEADLHETDLTSVAIVIGEILLFATATWFVSATILPKLIVLLHRVLDVPHLSFGLLLGGLFLVVVGAEGAGLHGSLGALLFGAALSTLPYQVRRDLMPGLRGSAEGLFVPLFFASAGLNLTFDFLSLPVATILLLVFVPLAGKFLAAFAGAYITRLDAPLAVAAGLMAKGVAEIALLLVLVHSGAIGTGVFSLLVLVMFAYILLTPIGITFALRRSDQREGIYVNGSSIPPSLVRFGLEGIRVRDVLDTSRSHPEQSVTVQNFVDNWLLTGQQEYIVVNQGEFAGIISVPLLRYLPHTEWASTTLGSIARELEEPRASSDDYVEDVLQRMTDHSISVLPVINPDTDEFIGSIASSEIVEMIVLTAQGHEI